ncbi:MAG: FeoA family protein [Geodermatophilaceae bacterium]
MPPRTGPHDERWADPLTAAPTGSRFRIERVSDRDPEALRYLADIGLRPGVLVEVGARAPFGGPLWITVDGAEHALGSQLTNLLHGDCSHDRHHAHPATESRLMAVPSRRQFLVGGAVLGNRRGRTRRRRVARHRSGGRRPCSGETVANPARAHGGGINGPTFRAGETVDHAANGFQPTEILRDFDYGTGVGLAGRSHVLREWEIFATDRGDRGRARASGSRPGRSTPGSRVRRCAAGRATCCACGSSTAPRTRTPCTSTASIRPRWTGFPAVGRGVISPGESFDLRASTPSRSGCTSTTATSGRWPSTSPAACTARSSSTRQQDRPPADELVMVMHGFNTTFDGEGNQLYAVNGIPFHYMHEPVQVAPR